MISFHDSFQQKPSCGRRLSLGATLFLACLALALGDSGAAQTLDCKIRNILTDGSPHPSDDNFTCGSGNQAGGVSYPTDRNNTIDPVPRLIDSINNSALGINNLATGGYSNAIGSRNNAADAAHSTVIGDYNQVGSDWWQKVSGTLGKGDKSTAIGYANMVYGSSSVVIGDSSEAGRVDLTNWSYAGGARPYYYANKAVAIGSFARARVDGTIAIGDTALAGMSALDLSGSDAFSYASTNAIAIGTNAKVYGTATTTGLNGVALGASAESTGNDSVALGAGSMDGGQSNVVAVGNSSSQRRIINLAAGVDPTDGVNVSQLRSMETTLTNQMNTIGDRAYAGTATVAAIAGIPALPQGKHFNIGAGFGNYLGQSGVAIGGNVRLNDVVVIKAAVGYANSNATTSVGLGYAF